MARKKKRIPPVPAVRVDQRSTTFSLRYLDPTNEKFKLDDCCDSFFRHLLRKMKDYGNLSIDEFRDENIDPHRHRITFENSTEKDGFPFTEDDVGSDEAWQFPLAEGSPGSKEAAWRVHGFIRDSVFYIVWLDHSHRLFLDGGYEKRATKKAVRL